ncbi:MAG: hypothetical protein EOO40_07780 [Deltaproteobacteria bacterium]|nr:MAG: hypothetical protein EOO40_07780 [Deltaproteobacteria bacterium]
MAEASSSASMGEQGSRAVRLREHALNLLRHAGAWLEIEGYPGRVRSYDDEELLILHRTPFQPPPISSAAEAAGIDAETQRMAAREYGLDIWRDKKKVLSLIWDGDHEVGVVVYKEGPWESGLVALARKHTPPASRRRR